MPFHETDWWQVLQHEWRNRLDMQRALQPKRRTKPGSRSGGVEIEEACSFKVGAIPFSEICGCLVCALQEIQ